MSNRKGLVLGAAALSALLISTFVGMTAAGDVAGEFGIFGGVLLPDKDISGRPEQLGEMEPVIGLRGALHFTDRWNWFVDGSWSEIGLDGGGNVDALTYRTGFERQIGDLSRDQRWFLNLGTGVLDLDHDRFGSTDTSFLSLGFGQRVPAGKRTNIRWELRVDRTLNNDDTGGEYLTMPQALIGFNWGGIKAVDSDGDGVYDRKDDCPDTPRGARVDENGCPLDGDGDGVFDGLDKCPDTPRGWPVDVDGCPKDSDGDGVFDGQDDCPGTPAGATVDDRGCPKDSDGDGVYDGIDKCPGTPKGARVDGRGCPKDSDGDGVFDGLDKCPDTPRGDKVDAQGCSLPKKAAPLFEEDKRALVLEGVNFELNSAELTAASTTILDKVATSMRDWPEVRVEIGGHTDSTGSERYNLDLSSRRTASVRDYLIGRGVAAERMVARGYGEARPIADNATEAGRAKNRRVELTKLN